MFRRGILLSFPPKTKKRYPKSGLKKVQKRTSEKPNPQEMLEILNEEP